MFNTKVNAWMDATGQDKSSLAYGQWSLNPYWSFSICVFVYTVEIQGFPKPQIDRCISFVKLNGKTGTESLKN